MTVYLFCSSMTFFFHAKNVKSKQQIPATIIQWSYGANVVEKGQPPDSRVKKEEKVNHIIPIEESTSDDSTLIYSVIGEEAHGMAREVASSTHGIAGDTSSIHTFRRC